MKGNEKIILKLNALLWDELTAINRHMVHTEMCGNWKYQGLYEILQKHAEKLKTRIL